MGKKKTLNTYAICEAIAKETGQPLGMVNKAVVAAGLSCLLEKTRLDARLFEEPAVEQLRTQAAVKARLHGLLK